MESKELDKLSKPQTPAIKVTFSSPSIEITSPSPPKAAPTSVAPSSQASTAATPSIALLPTLKSTTSATSVIPTTAALSPNVGKPIEVTTSAFCFGSAGVENSKVDLPQQSNSAFNFELKTANSLSPLDGSTQLPSVSSMEPILKKGLNTPSSNALSNPESQPCSHQLQRQFTAISQPILYGDERDTIIGKWNELQAFWGMGSGYYAPNCQPVSFTMDSPFSKLKCICYSNILQNSPEDGLVGLYFNKTEEEMLKLRQHISEFLNCIFGNQPNLAVIIEGFRTKTQNKGEMVIYLEEKLPTGITRRIPSTNVLAYLQQTKSQLTELGVKKVDFVPGLSRESLQQYLANPPNGINPFLWKQAILENPDSERYLPVAIFGSHGLLSKLSCQKLEVLKQQDELRNISESIAQLKEHQLIIETKIAENKRQQLEFGRRLLRVMVCQELSRKRGRALQMEDERLQIQLESLQSQLDSQYKGRVVEWLTHIKCHHHHNHPVLKSQPEGVKKYLKGQSLNIKQHLEKQSIDLKYLMNILKEDLKTLNFVEEGLKNNDTSTE